MKGFKKIILAIATTMVFSMSAFASSGFEFILNGRAGLGFGMPPQNLKESAEAKSELGLDAGVSAQFGYRLQAIGSFGISVLAELGYSHDAFYMSLDGNPLGIIGVGRISYKYSFDSFQVGLLPKLNFGNLAVGIGGGIKIPFGGKQTIKIGEEEASVKIKRSDIKEILNPTFTGYIKGTLDYSIFLTEQFAVNLGLYLEYDIINSKIGIGDKMERWGSLDIGLELGLKFGPRA